MGMRWGLAFGVLLVGCAQPAPASLPSAPDAGDAVARVDTSPTPRADPSALAWFRHRFDGGWGGLVDDRRVPGVPRGPPPEGRIDRAATAAALTSVSVAACKVPGGPTGDGQIKITFAPSGDVQSAVVGEPFEGTPVGKCIEETFSTVRIPAFPGPAARLRKSFLLE